MDVQVGIVRRAHGIAGELLVEPSTDHPGEVFRTGRILRVLGRGPIGLPAELTLTRARPHRKAWILACEELPDRTIAERYRGVRLGLAEDQLVEKGEGEFFFHELVDLEVRTRSDERLVGRVREVYDAAGAPVLSVIGEEGERLVPFVNAIVHRVDLETGTIWIEPPEGLLET